MNYIFLSVIFGVIWVAVTGAFTLTNLALGTAFGAGALFFIRGNIGKSPFFLRFVPVLSFIRLFLYELIMSAIKVAALVLRPDMDLQPGIFAYETALTKDSHITLLANLITLTPGTLTVDVSADRRTLFIHGVDCSDIKATQAHIRDGFERKIKEAFGDLG